MNFNNKHYLKLIKESSVLHQGGKFLKDHDKIKYDELCKYLIFLKNDILW